MKHIYYLFTLLPILFEYLNLQDTKRIHEFIERLKTTPHKEQTGYQKTYGVLMLGYWLWAVIGLFSFQWPVFLFMLILGAFPKKLIFVRWIDSLISIVVLIFIIVNAYHLHINLYQWLIK